MNLTGRGVSQKPEKKKSDPEYLSILHDLPCCICEYYGEEQRSPTQAHHWIMGRGGSRKTPDDEAIPLCEGHHQGQFDTSKTAIHMEPELWRSQYGTDKDWISWAQAQVAQIIAQRLLHKL
jgi:hypothetical protein